MPTFEPPVVQDLPMVITDPVTARQNPLHNRLFRHYSPAHRGRSVLKAADGSYTYTTVDYPTTDQIDAASAHWLGGHVYTVDDTEAYYLDAYGYNVRDMPVPPVAPPGLGGYGDLYTADYA